MPHAKGKQSSHTKGKGMEVWKLRPKNLQMQKIDMVCMAWYDDLVWYGIVWDADGMERYDIGGKVWLWCGIV